MGPTLGQKVHQEAMGAWVSQYNHPRPPPLKIIPQSPL